jgi:hypothetical protein
VAKRYFIELSRKDTGMVSYFPGLEVKNDPDGDWIEEVLVPAIEPLVWRKDKTIRNVPITFWAAVRETARRTAEIFVFTTPGRPGARMEQALSRPLQFINGGHVHAATEPIPEEAFPCFQLFRGRLIRFCTTLEGNEGFYLPTIRWKNISPVWVLLAIPDNDELIDVDVPIEDAERLLARAEISPVLDGPYFRKFQQAMSTIAREEK